MTATPRSRLRGSAALHPSFTQIARATSSSNGIQRAIARRQDGEGEGHGRLSRNEGRDLEARPGTLAPLRRTRSPSTAFSVCGMASSPSSRPARSRPYPRRADRAIPACERRGLRAARVPGRGAIGVAHRPAGSTRRQASRRSKARRNRHVRTKEGGRSGTARRTSTVPRCGSTAGEISSACIEGLPGEASATARAGMPGRSKRI